MRVGAVMSFAGFVVGLLVLVQGQVTAQIFGNAVSGALVLALHPTTGRPIGSATSDGSGNYSMLVPAGSGLLLVADPAYGHISRLESTTPTTFTDGGTVTVNVQLSRYLGGIEGRVADTASGNGIAGGLALAFDAATGRARAGAMTDGFGFWVVRNLRSVGYHMELLDPTGAHVAGWPQGASSRATASTVNVIGGALQVIGTDTLDAATAPAGSTVQGTVTDTGGPLANVAAVVYDATTEAFEAAGLTDGSGHYSVTVDAGDHLVQFVDTSGDHQSEWYADQPDGEIDAATAVTAPAVADALLGAAEGTVSGTVTEEGTGVPLAGVTVLATDAAGIIGVAQSAADGTYAIADVPAGATRVWFADGTLAHLREYFDGRRARLRPRGGLDRPVGDGGRHLDRQRQPGPRPVGRSQRDHHHAGRRGDPRSRGVRGRRRCPVTTQWWTDRPDRHADDAAGGGDRNPAREHPPFRRTDPDPTALGHVRVRLQRARSPTSADGRPLPAVVSSVSALPMCGSAAARGSTVAAAPRAVSVERRGYGAGRCMRSAGYG